MFYPNERFTPYYINSQDLILIHISILINLHLLIVCYIHRFRRSRIKQELILKDQDDEQILMFQYSFFRKQNVGEKYQLLTDKLKKCTKNMLFCIGSWSELVFESKSDEK